MSEYDAALFELLKSNPQITIAWVDEKTSHTILKIRTAQPGGLSPLNLPTAFSNFSIERKITTEIKILPAIANAAPPQNLHQQCQDEPIQLGTQIQPKNRPWLGTAGAPIKWVDQNGDPHWGILSNYHVMAMGIEDTNHPMHQPTDNAPAMATLYSWKTVNPNNQNTIDAAIADALTDGFHTIDDRVLGIGKLSDSPIDARVGLAVMKSGRTTGITHGVCTATGAAVTVSYGEFSATFVDQDVFEANSGAFSGPGDSGSLIIGASCKCPCSLLFAGNAQTTIGNPIHYVNEEFSIMHPFTSPRGRKAPTDRHRN